MWARWSKEYIKSLRERQRLQGARGVRAPAVDEIVIIKSEEKNRNRWKLGKVDEVVRGARVQTEKGVLERTPQHFYPLELKCDQSEKRSLNVEALEFQPKCQASKDAKMKIGVAIANEQDSD